MPEGQAPHSVPLARDGMNASKRNATLEISRSVMYNNDAKAWFKKYRTEVAASTSSLLSTFVAFPLDSVKTRMQSYDFKNFLGCVRSTYKTEGFHGFWRGVWAPLASITFVRTVSFSVYQRSKYTYNDWIYRATGQNALAIANQRGANPNWATIACFGAAGATSGAVITAIACPFELTKLASQLSVLMKNEGDGKPTAGAGKDTAAVGAKVKSVSPLDGSTATGVTNEVTKNGASKAVANGSNIQNRLASSGGNKVNPLAVADENIRHQYEKKGTWRTAKMLLQQRGYRGLYHGFYFHLVRDTIGTGVYFMTYESAKQLLANARGHSPTSPLAVVTAGGLCGLVSWAVIYPIDSAKSIYQRNCLLRKDGKAVVPKVEYGKRHMYRGLSVSMSRSAIVNAVFFSVFEILKKRINRLDVDEDLLRRSRELREA